METFNKKRIFLALPIPATLRDSLNFHAQVWQQRIATQNIATDSLLRWSHPDDYHLTLHFLGDLAGSEITDLVQRIEPILQRQSAFKLQLGSFEFLSTQHPHSWVIRVEPAPELLQLHSEIGTVLNDWLRKRKEREYLPHITLAKLPRNVSAEVLSALNDNIANTILAKDKRSQLLPFTAQQVLLYETLPQPLLGRRYGVLECFKVL